MAIVMISLVPVFLDGRVIDKGEKFACTPEFAQALKKSKSAEPLDVTEVKEPEVPKLTKNDLIQLAAEHEVEVSGNATKSEIEEVLTEAGVDLHAEIV